MAEINYGNNYPQNQEDSEEQEREKEETKDFTGQSVSLGSRFRFNSELSHFNLEENEEDNEEVK